MGGIVSAEYCFISDIQYCSILKHGILLELKSGCQWKKFPAKIGNIEIEVTEQTNVVRDIWEVSAKIRCPRKEYETTNEMMVFRRKRKVLLKYITANGDVNVVGTLQFPLSVTYKILNGILGSGFAGVEFLATGLQYCPQLPLL